jgi:hypothetical protein
MDAVALIDVAIKDRGSFKSIGKKLGGLPPSENAAKRLISAFNANRCQPWLTAYLLGCIRHPAGYETAKCILLSNSRLGSEGYAGAAMAVMRGEAAYDDLRQIVFSNHPRKVRDGAACGLPIAQSGRALDDLLVAFVERRISSTATIHVAQCNPPDSWLLQLIESDDPRKQRFACTTIDRLLNRHRSPVPGEEVAAAVRQLLDRQIISSKSPSVNHLLKWLNGTLDERMD